MTARRLAVLLAILMLLTLSSACKSKSSDGTDDSVQETTTTDRDNGTVVSSDETTDSSPAVKQPITIPCLLEDGKLQVSSLFQFTGMNPDADGQMGENIATLELVNNSDEYLSEAEISVVLSDGTTLQFAVTDLPSGKTVWAFEKLCGTCPDGTPDISSITCTADFADTVPAFPDGLIVNAEDIALSLTNTGTADLTNLTVCCHCNFSDVYFGGITYAYTVDRIPAGETVTVTAVDCFLGEAEVVRIITDDTNP
ncbi:MAG: hypothetical protein ACI3YK_05575 [Eubacteriales bacterium]